MDAYARFGDLLYFTALNLYNRRAGWPKGYYTLSPSDLLGGAEFLLVKDRPGDKRAPPPHGFVSLPCEGKRGDVRLFRRRDPPAGSYRETYAREFLRRVTVTDHRELSTIYFSLFMIERLRGVVPDREKLLSGFPERFKPGRDVRNIFWITHELPLRALAWSAYEDHLAGRL